MKTQKTLTFAALAVLALGTVGATELNTIIESAKENSPSYQNSVITYQNGLINVQKLEKDEDQIVYTITGDGGDFGSISSTGTSSGKVLEITKSAYDDVSITATPSLTIELPNDGKTTITSSLSASTDTGGVVKSISGKVGVTHTLDFVGYTSTADDLTYTSTKYDTELTYQKATINFKKTVISSVSSLLSAEKSLEKNKDTLLKQEKTLANMEALGTYSSTSPTYIKAQNTIKSLRESLEAAEQQLADARYNYKVLTGMDWDYLDPLPEPELNLVTYEGGNTSVLLVSLSAESAMDRYASLLAAYNPNSLVVSGNLKASGESNGNTSYGGSGYSVSGSASYVGKNWSASVTPSVSQTYRPETDSVIPPASYAGIDKVATTSYSLNASAKYAEDNWYIQATPSIVVTTVSNADTSVQPTLTISGKWTNKASASTEDQELQTLLNTAQARQNDYVSAMSSYTQSAQDYAVRIMNWNYKKAQAEANMDYLEMLLENEKALFSLGLATETDVADAELNISQAQYDWDIMILEGLSLQCDLEAFAL